jgi:hypothetical protein
VTGGYFGKQDPRERRAFFEADRKLRAIETGVQGPPGPAGPAGTSGGSFAFTQMSPGVSWTINHNLGYRPAVTTFDTGGDEIVGRVVHTSVNQAVVHFSVGVSGTAHLS